MRKHKCVSVLTEVSLIHFTRFHCVYFHLSELIFFTDFAYE